MSNLMFNSTSGIGRKPFSGFLYQVRHKPDRTATEADDLGGLKFWPKEEGLYYLCTENKGPDQLRGYHTADLHLCFRTCKNQVFS